MIYIPESVTSSEGGKALMIFGNGTEKLKNGAAPVLLLLFVGITLWSWYFYIHRAAEVPVKSDWQAAVDYLGGKFQNGDLLVSVPWWADEGEEAYVKAGLPYRYLQRVDKEVFAGYSRLWILSTFGRFKESQAEKRGYRLESFNEIGPVGVYLYSIPQPEPLSYDFRANIARAHVFVRRDKRDKDCKKWDAARQMHFCGPGSWNWIGPETIERDMAQRDVLWAHPLTGAEIHIAFEDVPITKELVVQHGLSEYAARLKEGVPVFIDVYIDGVLQKRVRQDNVRGWFIERITPKDMLGQRHEVEFVVRAREDGRRHFHFSAQAI